MSSLLSEVDNNPSTLRTSELLNLLRELLNEIEKQEQQETIPYTLPKRLEEEEAFALGSATSQSDFVTALKKVLTQTPSTARYDFANQLFGGREHIAVLGEWLAAFINTSNYTFKVAGAQIFIEKTLIHKLLDAAGLRGGEGLFVPGGSLSNLSAMLVARSTRFPDSKEKGLSNLPPLAIYTSEASHYSITKNANIMGLGRKSVRHIPCDENGRMRVSALRAAIEDDLAHHITPFFINATAGTTVLGAFDPISEIAVLSKHYGIWLHVDGAYGASVLLSQRYRHLCAGTELIDSMSWDAHKMLGIPMHCSVVLFKNQGGQLRVFSEQAEYLFQTEHAFNPGDASIQCGRRNDALKLWTFWKALGDKGLEARIDLQFQKTAEWAELIKKHPRFHLLYEPELINVCFQLKGVETRKLCEALDRMGLAKIGYGSFQGETFIRFVCVNPKLSRDHMEILLERIVRAGDNLQPQSV